MARKIRKKTQDANTTQEGTGKILTAGLNLRRKSCFFAVLIGLLALLLYLPTLQSAFVGSWDDNRYVVANPHIRALNWEFLRWAMFDIKYHLWHPLTWISHAVDYSLWGLNPFGHHLMNIILHAINTGVVVYLSIYFLDAINEMRQRTEGIIAIDQRGMIITGCVTGLLFGVHPLHVESVAWIAERKDLLYSFFYLLSIASYTNYVRALGKTGDSLRFSPNRQYFSSLALFSLALCSKPMAVTLPVVLLVLDWYPFKRTTTMKSVATLFIEKLPFLVLSLSASAATILVQKTVGALRTLEEASVLVRVLVAFRAIVLYLWKILVPVDLLPYYPYPKDASLFRPAYLMAIILVCLTTAGCLFLAKRRPIWLACWLYFIISLFPILGFLQAGNQFIADRFVYLPSLGPFFLVGLGAAATWKKADSLQEKLRWVKRPLAAGMLAIIVILSFQTVRQTRIWRNSIELWTYFIGKKPLQYPEVYFFRGEEYVAQGNFDKAKEDFTTTISMDPKHDSAYMDRGLVAMAQGRQDEAIKDFSMAISINPKSADAYSNRGNAYYKKGDVARAIIEYSTAVSTDPTFYTAYINRGIIYKEKGADDKAIADFTSGLSLNPSLVKVYLVRGDLYMKKGETNLALKDFEKACSLGDQVGCTKSFFPFRDINVKGHPGS